MELELKKLSEELEVALREIDLPNEPKNLYDPLRYFLALGGKRIRPVLTLLGGDLFGKDHKACLHASLAIELFHNFSLIHDDIMDEAPLRRGKETVHEKWNTNIAILSGDVLLVKAYQELCKQEAKHIPDLMHLFNRTAVEVCDGQQMDMDFERETDISIEQYIEMIRLKTSVLLGCALELGAIVADASTDDRKAIYTFGESIGIGFQIQDDLLDLYAQDAVKFGKQIGGDIISNKKTILFLKALELADSTQRNRLNDLKNVSDNTLKVKLAKELFEELNIKEEVKKLRDFYFEKGIAELNKIEVVNERKEKLFALTNYLKDREV